MIACEASGMGDPGPIGRYERFLFVPPAPRATP